MPPETLPVNDMFSEALTNIQEGRESGIPSYVVAADTLNTANNNKTFIESAAETVDDVNKFVGLAVISGASQIYNIAPDVGNLLGGNYDRLEMEDVVADLDDDLSKFYQEHDSSVDLAGFLVSSLVPGSAGVKILNVGQKAITGARATGKLGGHLGKASGLLAPPKQSLINKAVKEVATNSNPAALTNANSLKAITAGAGQGALEAAAFEVAVAGTMFNSPVLEDQDFGDLVSNIAFSAGVFGTLSGVITAAKVNSKLKAASRTAELEARPWQHIEESASRSSAFEKMALDYEQLSAMPEVPRGLSAERTSYLNAAKNTKKNKLENRIRSYYAEIAGGDQVVAESLYKTLKNEPVRTQQSATIGLVEVSTLAQNSRYASRIERLHIKEQKGTITLDEMVELADSEIQTAYTKMWGEGVGKVVTERPNAFTVSDMLKKGQTIDINPRSGVRITGTDTKWKFDLKYNKPRAGKKPGKGKDIKPWTVFGRDSREANARYMWAQELPKFEVGPDKILTVHVDDFPIMEKVMDDLSTEELQFVRFTGFRQGEFDNVADNIADFLGKRKIEAAVRMLGVRGQRTGVTANTQEEIATITNVRNSALSGELRVDTVNTLARKDMLAMQSYAEDYTNKLISKGEWSKENGLIPVWKQPQHLKLTYDASSEGASQLAGLNNHVVENMVIIKEQQRMYQDGLDRAAAYGLGDDYNKFEDIRGGGGVIEGSAEQGYARVRTSATNRGAGASILGAASSNYGTLAASVENIGKTTEAVIEKFKAATREALIPHFDRLSKKQDAAVEWATLNRDLRAIPENYTLSDDGSEFVLLKMKRWEEAVENAGEGADVPPMPKIDPDVPASIPIKHQEVRDLAKVHIETNGMRTDKLGVLRTSQGLQYNRDPLTFYPVPVDPRDYPYFAMVVDRSVTSGNQSKTLYATTQEELDSMVRKLKENPQLEIFYKKEAEDYYKSRGQFDYEKTLSDNYIDVEAKRKGVSAPFLVSTDPEKIVGDTMKWHMTRETGLVRELVSAKYEVAFEELKRLGEQFTDVGTSRFGTASLYDFAEEQVKNPYIDYIRTALGIKKTADYPFLTRVNQMADERISALYNRISGVFNSARNTEDLTKVNQYLKEAGFKGAHYDETMEVFANRQPDRGILSKTVAKANSLLATVILRWDTLNAVNNAVSANVLLGAEARAVVSAIERGDREAVGALASLTRVKVPGTDRTIFSPQKLIQNAVSKFSTKGEDFTFYKENNYMTRIADQYRDVLDDIAFSPAESASAWQSRIDGAFKKAKDMGDRGEIITGNKLAEEFNRFVAADVMKQMTDIAVSRGLMTQKESLAYINTFVNRTQGNYLASQRPMLFHGPLGQAVGLFQTYQFNLMQQLLRHVGEGKAKDAMTLLGLQGTIHGMNGLPAFNAINTHLIGNASGNTAHKDIYSSVYTAAGKEAGDWLMYGVGSNALGLLHPDLKMNLYTRGDINPRHVTVVPTRAQDVPIYQASARFFSNLFNTAGELAAGADVSTTLLQGLEHNSLSRPLAGLAQTLEGFNNPNAVSYSTSKKGNVIASNDLLSLANLGRMLGGKPLDEAIALDATYRFKTYALKDSSRRRKLGAVIKSKVIAGQYPTQEEIEDFSQRYVEQGGRINEFNQWLSQLYSTANASQANEIQKSLSSPFTQSMQAIMGGRQLRDFENARLERLREAQEPNLSESSE